MREKLIPGERSISAVLTDIVRNIQEIVRGEIRLAGTEVREELRSARGAALLVLAGAVAGAFSVLFVLLAAFTALSRSMAPWAAGVCIAAALAIIALTCCGLGLRRLRTARPAAKAVDSVKENLEWVKQRTR